MAGSGGYTASAEALSAASKNLTQLAEDLGDDNKELGKSEITEAQFGEAHREHAKKYTDGVRKLDAAIKGMATSLTNLGNNLGTAGKKYSASDQAQADTASNAGRP